MRVRLAGVLKLELVLIRFHVKKLLEHVVGEQATLRGETDCLSVGGEELFFNEPDDGGHCLSDGLRSKLVPE